MILVFYSTIWFICQGDSRFLSLIQQPPDENDDGDANSDGDQCFDHVISLTRALYYRVRYTTKTSKQPTKKSHTKQPPAQPIKHALSSVCVCVCVVCGVVCVLCAVLWWWGWWYGVVCVVRYVKRVECVAGHALW
jgi:hypothetical protein